MWAFGVLEKGLRDLDSGCGFLRVLGAWFRIRDLRVRVHSPQPWSSSSVRGRSLYTWVVVKIRVPFWVPIIIRHLLLRVPKKGP